MEIKSLSEIAFIFPGHHFRGAVSPQPSGAVRVIQMRDVAQSEGIRWDQIVRSALPGKKNPVLLRQGDILFVTRGLRLFAVFVDEEPAEPTVPVSHFLNIRVKPELTDRVLPEFLAWQINRAPVQQQLNRLAAGTSLPNVSKSALTSLLVYVPASIEKQKRIVDLDRMVQREITGYQKLIENRVALMDAIAFDLTDSIEETA